MQMNEILAFLRELAANNNRDWFNENKETYQEVKRMVDSITQDLINRISKFEPQAAMLSVSDCTYRIYRDVRFSTDKSPYKTHIGIFINPPFGKKSLRSGFYLHLEPNESAVYIGTYCLPSKYLAAIRRDIFENVDEYLEIIENPEFKNIFPTVGENPLKTAPKGFPKDWKHISLLKPRDYAVKHSLSDRELNSPKALDKIVDMFRISKPFNDFINFAIDEVGNEADVHN